MATVIECGSNPKAWQPNPGAEPAEAADHLVADDVDVVLGADRQYLVEIGRGWNEHAARSHHRLDEECRDRVRPFPLDQVIELGGKPRCELLLALAVMREAIVMRAEVCRMLAIGTSKSVWLAGSPVSEADAIVTP